MVGTGLQQYYEAILDVVSSVQESEIKQDGSIDIERGRQYYETPQDFQDSPFSKHGSP